MKIKTICFLINGLDSGGAERVVSTLSNSLVKNNNVIIITLRKTVPFYNLNSKIKIEYCEELIPPSSTIFQALYTNFKLYNRIQKFLLKHNADICFGFMTSANIIATLAARKLEIPVVICERNNPEMEDSKLSPIWIKLRKIIYPKASILIVQTTEIKNFFLKYISAEKIRTIPNPINPNFIINPSLEKHNTILSVGRLNHQKAQHILIKAFADLDPVDWKLVIIGEGIEREKLENLIDKLGMSSKISLIGKVENVEKYYQTSKIFAFTSIYEGFPNALLEAMFFGLACISTDCPTGPSELISNGKNGYLISVNSEKELSAKLFELISNSSLRKTLGEQSKISVKKYELENIIQDWESIITELSD